MSPCPECGVRSAERRPDGDDRRRVIPPSAITVPRSTGFTLLEVMVAVAILGLVIVSLLGLRNRSVQDVETEGRITTATMLAERKMVETLSAALVPLEDDGEFEEEEFKEYTWKRVVAPAPIPVVPPIMEARVAVLWKEGEREEQVELVSYE